MQHERIKALLVEAASPACDPARTNQIQAELGHETAAMRPDGVYDIDNPQAGLQLAVDALFVSTVKNRREALPGLFPVFSLLCGDRDGNSIVADIDWSQVD